MSKFYNSYQTNESCFPERTEILVGQGWQGAGNGFWQHIDYGIKLPTRQAIALQERINSKEVSVSNCSDCREFFVDLPTPGKPHTHCHDCRLRKTYYTRTKAGKFPEYITVNARVTSEQAEWFAAQPNKALAIRELIQKELDKS